MRLTNTVKACSQNTIFYNGVKRYNSLPMEVKMSDTLKEFETKLKKYVMEKN